MIGLGELNTVSVCQLASFGFAAGVIRAPGPSGSLRGRLPVFVGGGGDFAASSGLPLGFPGIRVFICRLFRFLPRAVHHKAAFCLGKDVGALLLQLFGFRIGVAFCNGLGYRQGAGIRCLGPLNRDGRNPGGGFTPFRDQEGVFVQQGTQDKANDQLQGWVPVVDEPDGGHQQDIAQDDGRSGLYVAETPGNKAVVDVVPVRAERAAVFYQPDCKDAQAVDDWVGEDREQGSGRMGHCKCGKRLVVDHDKTHPLVGQEVAQEERAGIPHKEFVPLGEIKNQEAQDGPDKRKGGDRQQQVSVDQEKHPENQACQRGQGTGQAVDAVGEVEGVDDDDKNKQGKKHRNPIGHLPDAQHPAKTRNPDVREQDHDAGREDLAHEFFLGRQYNQVVLDPQEQEDGGSGDNRNELDQVCVGEFQEDPEEHQGNAEGQEHAHASQGRSFLAVGTPFARVVHQIFLLDHVDNHGEYPDADRPGGDRHYGNKEIGLG